MTDKKQTKTDHEKGEYLLVDFSRYNCRGDSGEFVFDELFV